MHKVIGVLGMALMVANGYQRRNIRNRRLTFSTDRPYKFTQTLFVCVYFSSASFP
jgi:hypothetical protein